MEALPRLAPFLRDYQADTLVDLTRALAELRGETFTVLYPRQAGKNQLAAALVAELLLGNSLAGGTVVVCAPTFQPQAGISLARVRDYLALVEPRLRPELDMRFGATGVSAGFASAVFLGASPEAHVAGHTASLALVADEAQEIDEEWFDRQFRPMTASTAAPVFLFGTPWNGETLLDHAVARNRARDEARAPGAPALHHEASWERVAAAVPFYRLHVERERDRLGPRHPLFRTQYGLETTEAAGRLLDAAGLAALGGLHPRERGPAPGDRYVAGLDFGGDRERSDATVLTIGRVVGSRCEVVDVRAWQGEPFAVVEAEVRGLARHWRFARVCADATGMGAPLVAGLTGELGSTIERFTFTGRSKSELGYALIAAAGTGRVALFADDGTAESAACRAQLRACQARATESGELRWAAPAGRHDDYVVSLALCLRAAETLGPPRVAVGRRR